MEVKECKSCRSYGACPERRGICDKFKPSGLIQSSPRGEAPTRKQKIVMDSYKLVWKNWLVVNEDNISITVVNKTSGRRKLLLK